MVKKPGWKISEDRTAPVDKQKKGAVQAAFLFVNLLLTPSRYVGILISSFTGRILMLQSAV